MKSRFEVNPSVGGFLRSEFCKPSDLGRRIEQGTKLGEVVDIQTLEVIEEAQGVRDRIPFFLPVFRCRRCGHQGIRACRRSDFHMAVSKVRAILLASNDDVAAALDTVESGGLITVVHNTSGEAVAELVARRAIPFGHKIAVRDIANGHRVNRYGFPIGIATSEIKKGEHVHGHNMRSMLSPASKQEAEPSAMRPARWVHDVVKGCLQAVGAHSEGAEAMATAVTEAHLRGVETHGLRRLRPYVTRLRSGGVNAKARPQADQNQGLVRIDGGNGIGHHVAAFAANAASDAARQFGIAIALVKNSNHFGFAGYYATLIAGRKQLGIVTSNGQVCVAPGGSTKPLLSNNPIAIAAPTGQPDSYLELDLATSVTSRANVVEAARSGRLLPDGWAPSRMECRPAIQRRRSRAVCWHSGPRRVSACLSLWRR